MRACAGRTGLRGPRAWLPRAEGGFVAHPGRRPPRASHRGLDASGRLEGPGRVRGAGQSARDPPAPDSDGFQRSNPQLPHRRPLGPFPPRSERKKERRRRRRAAPLTMIRGGGAGPGGRRCAVQGSRRPSARAPGRRAPHPRPRPRPRPPTPGARTPPPAPPRPPGLAPLQRGAPSLRAVSGARRSPPPPRAGASPAAARGGLRGRGEAGQATAPGGLARPRAGARLLARGRGAPCRAGGDLQAQRAPAAREGPPFAVPARTQQPAPVGGLQIPVSGFLQG